MREKTMKKNSDGFRQLHAPYEDAAAASWDSVHPSPLMKRSGYRMLNGIWDLSVIHKGAGTHSLAGKINVPLPPECGRSVLSCEGENTGAQLRLKKGESWLYERDFEISEKERGGRVLLHFGAVDQVCRVSVNGTPAGRHKGGYLPFVLDITHLTRQGENHLSVQVWDNNSPLFGRGKQRRRRGGMWYTPFSGIWQSVWLEFVPHIYVKQIRITPRMDRVTIVTQGGAEEKVLFLNTDSGIRTYRYRGDRLTIRFGTELPGDEEITQEDAGRALLEKPYAYCSEQAQLWSPEDPHLYSFVLQCGEDLFESYFALREIKIAAVNGKPRFLLNGKPIFLHGVLDQGYYPDGISTPVSPQAYADDIQAMKDLGFNMLRKHIKIEPECYYHECDRRGMIVMQDLVSSGVYNYLWQTVLPTAGLLELPAIPAGIRRKKQFIREARETLRFLYSHPCVCGYTIFNEGWGQFDADKVYEMLKHLDPSRFYDTTSGWFTRKKSDVVSIHNYFFALKIKKDKERPCLLSEFGGFSWKIDEHSYNPEESYGYREYRSQQELENALEEIYRGEIIPLIREGLAGTVLTQVSDVEDETNGLLTYDRQVVKVDAGRMRRIASDLYTAAGQWKDL